MHKVVTFPQPKINPTHAHEHTPLSRHTRTPLSRHTRTHTHTSSPKEPTPCLLYHRINPLYHPNTTRLNLSLNKCEKQKGRCFKRHPVLLYGINIQSFNPLKLKSWTK